MQRVPAHSEINTHGLGVCKDTQNEGDFFCSFDPRSTAPERSREINVAEVVLGTGSKRVLL